MPRSRASAHPARLTVTAAAAVAAREARGYLQRELAQSLLLRRGRLFRLIAQDLEQLPI